MLPCYLLSEALQQNQQLPAPCGGWSGCFIATRQQSWQCLHVPKLRTSNGEVCEVRVRLVGSLRTCTLDCDLSCLPVAAFNVYSHDFVYTYRFIFCLFIAVHIACSTCFGHHYAHHQELKSIIQWLLPVVFRAVVCRMLQHPANRAHNPQLHTRPATWKPQHETPQAATTV